MDILQYESKIWETADLLRGAGIKESEWPSFMMPFFALAMIESRLIRMFDELKEEFGEEVLSEVDKVDLFELINDKGQGYNVFIFEHEQSLSDICKNDKSFDIDFDAYLNGFDGETKDLLGVEASEGEKFLDIKGVIGKLKAKKILLAYTKLWASIDLKPFNNSEITTLEEHIKRKWADISAETAGEQYTPDDVIALIAEIIASKIKESDTLLKIYDCTCGGGNMLFGVEDRINQKFARMTQTFGQDWNDALYALAKIESRFRIDSKIEHGNTLVDDKFYNDEFDVVIANPPYGVSWKGYQKDIKNDKTDRFQFLPSISDGQLLFMQHLISKLDRVGMGVVVHNGSTLFSGDAGSAESNIRKWMLDSDIVEAIIQLPTDEFFNTGIYTYLWVLNKNKQPYHNNKVMLINASEKFTALKKSKGSKRKEVDKANRLDIVATLTAYKDNDYARVFDKEFFYFNKQAIRLTNIDEQANSYEAHLPLIINKKTGESKKAASVKLNPIKLSNNEGELEQFEISEYDTEQFASLLDYIDKEIKPFLASLNYKTEKKEQRLIVTSNEGDYYYDTDQDTLIREFEGKQEALGCGKIIVKSAYKKATKTKAECFKITVELMPDYQKDYEIIPFKRDEVDNQQAIEAFMAKYIYKPFEYLDNTIGVEINFNKVFYKPEKLRAVSEILGEIVEIDNILKSKQTLINETITHDLNVTKKIKNSGVDRIEKMPAHWAVKRVKELAIITNGSTPKSSVEENWEGQIFWVTTDDLGKLATKFITNTKRKITSKGYSSCGVTNCPIGSIVISGRAPIGHIGILNIEACSNQGCKTLVVNKKLINSLFLYYYLLSSKPKLESLGRGTTFIELSTKELSLFNLPLPSLDEQQEITDYLDKKTSQIDEITENLNAQIKKLKELRKTLINDVVTGKIKVSE